MFGIGNWPELVTAIVNKLGINVLSCASDLCACVILEANKENFSRIQIKCFIIRIKIPTNSKIRQ